MKYSEYLQLRELIEKEEQDTISLNEGLLTNLFKMGGKALWALIQKNAKKAISSGIESNFKTKLDKDAETIKDMLVKKLNIKQKPQSTSELDEKTKEYVGQIKKEVQEYQKLTKKNKGRVDSYAFQSLINSIYRLAKNNDDEDLQKALFDWHDKEHKTAEDNKEIYDIILAKIPKDPEKEEPDGGDEILKKIDQESDTMFKAVLDKRNIKNPDDPIALKIKEKVLQAKDKKVIQYMSKVLKNQSDIVLKSIEDKEKLEKEDKDNLKLYWESKMTVLEIELSMLLANMGYIEDLSSSFEDWMKEVKKY